MARHIGKNLVIILALLGAGFFTAWLRFHQYLGSEGSYTDGTRTFEVNSANGIRFAVWDSPVVLPETVNTSEDERQPAVSPDGRYLVFAGGELGLGTDLYISEVEGGEPGEPRPLHAINSGADEWAPCFSGGALYFASNRRGSAGGLDLWRAAYDRGVFGEPERIEGGVNSSADDTDPAPVPGTDAIVFASDRQQSRRGASDFNLFLAKPIGGEEAWSIEPIEELNTFFDERDPAFTSDGRTLFFASDRDGTIGGFDLYRSALSAVSEAHRWIDPEPLVGINTAASERAPSPSQDGFLMYFEVEAGGEAGGESGGESGTTSVDLYRAHSLELFRTPGRPVGWRELLILALLLAIALLAWLAKQWEHLEVLYKCVLISLVLHLLLMWWLRDVYPEGGEYELEGDSNRIRVRLMSNDQGPIAANTERGGALEVARLENESEAEMERFEVATEEAAAQPDAASAMLERPAAAESSEPARAAAELARAAAAQAEVELQKSTESFERMSGSSPELALETGVAATPEAAALADPSRAASAEARMAEVAPEEYTQERSGAGAALPDAPHADSAKVARVSEPLTDSFDVAQPEESITKRRSEAPSLALDAGFTEERVPRGVETAQPARASAPDVLEGRVAVAPDSGPLEARADAEEYGLDPLAGRASAEVSRTAAANPAVPLSDRPTEAFERIAQDTAHDDQLLADVPDEFARRAKPDAEVTPRRFENERSQADSMELAPARFEPDASRRSREEEPFAQPDFRAAARDAEPSEREMPRVAFDDSPEVPEPRVGVPDEAEARARDWESGLARDLSSTLAALDAPERKARGSEPDSLTPRRFEREEAAADTGPSFEPLVASNALSEAPGALPVEQWEHTPYKTRTGESKLRAIEEHGGSDETEAAVASGLAYLARIQKSEGYWGSPDDRHEKYEHVVVGKTGLAMLAFMGAGHTQNSNSQYSQNVDRAIGFLLAVQDESNGHFGYTSSYSHAIATYALGECYALTKDVRLKAPIERGVAQIVRKQKHSDDSRFDGGWGYYYPNSRTIDRWPRASVTAWQVMALESARLGGLHVDDKVFADAKTFLTKCWDRRRGAFRYSHDPDRLDDDFAILPGSTPASLFALSLLGDDIATNDFREGRSFVLERAPERYRFRGNEAFVHRAEGNLYFWYYGTLALFRAGGSPWRQWNEAMKETLLPAQEEDGSWEPISAYATRYAGDDDDDRTYSTAMCVLTLEVYYRYFTPLLKVD